MMKALLAVLALCAAVLAQSPSATPPTGTTVKIDNFMFSPVTIEIQHGTSVTWVNKDDIPHTVASTTGKFRSRAIDTDGSFSYTFNEPGTYDYYCSVHPKMIGKVVVK